MALVRGPAGRCSRGARGRDRTAAAVASNASPSASASSDVIVLMVVLRLRERRVTDARTRRAGQPTAPRGSRSANTIPLIRGRVLFSTASVAPSASGLVAATSGYRTTRNVVSSMRSREAGSDRVRTVRCERLEAGERASGAHRERNQRQRGAVSRRRREHRRVGDDDVVDVPQALPRVAHRSPRIVAHPSGAHPVAGDRAACPARANPGRSRRREPVRWSARPPRVSTCFEPRAPVVRARRLVLVRGCT